MTPRKATPTTDPVTGPVVSRAALTAALVALALALSWRTLAALYLLWYGTQP